MSATNDNITIIEMENKGGTEKQDSNEEQLKLRLPRNESNLVLFNQLIHKKLSMFIEFDISLWVNQFVVMSTTNQTIDKFTLVLSQLNNHVQVETVRTG